jgi:(S)-2-hydroxyglutarate dehydrogenase
VSGYDVGIVGGGIIGLAVARSLTITHPGVSLAVFDKEERIAAHQTGHSSGVIHSGLYYRPGSLKARLAVAGAREMYRLVEEGEIPHRRSGKLVIATRPSELPALDELERRGHANGLSGLRRVGRAEITEIEPAATGIAALHVPEAGVTDFARVADLLATHLTGRGAVIHLGHRVSRIDQRSDSVDLVANDTRYPCRVLVNCAGLHSDRVAALAGVTPEVRIVPFRGEYYTLGGPPAEAIQALIYPVPDPRYPFLGVHFTRSVHDTVEVGPNALLALGREQYRGRGPAWGDLGEMFTYPGFWRLAAKNLPAGSRELVSRFRGLYARQARRLVPSVERSHLTRAGAGIRAQAVDRRGRLVDDFVIETVGSTVHVLNAPSPGGTASLAIGAHIAGLIPPLLK